MSGYQVVTSAAPTSVVPSQSSSTSLQTSVAAGLTAASVSSQSELSLTDPLGAEQETELELASPKPSLSASLYQVAASTLSSGSMSPSQSLSMPSQTSDSPGFTAASVSSQSSALLA